MGFLSQTHGLAWAIGAFATGAYVMVILTALLLPRPRDASCPERDADVGPARAVRDQPNTGRKKLRS